MKPSTIARLFFLLTLGPGLSAAQETEWLVAPYVWGSAVTLDLASGGSANISAKDLVDKSDTVGMIRIEVARNKWGLSLDYLWLGVSGSTNQSTPGPLPISINVQAGLDLNMLELVGVYRPTGDENGFKVLFGARQTSVDTNLLVTANLGGPTQVFNADEEVTDAVLGARFMRRFNDNWDFTVRGDYGFGDSDGTFNFMTGVGWRTSGAFGMQLSYRDLHMKFDQVIDGENLTTEIDLSGPLLGFLFRF
jgi:hypothetical protein